MVSAFHDERQVGSWLYHGLIIVERRHWDSLDAALRRARERSGCGRPVHFHELNSSSSGSRRTKLALAWVRGLDAELLPLIRFFLLGIDLTKSDRRFFGDESSTRKELATRRYNRFFEMALYVALRWFFSEYDDVELESIYAEERSLPTDDPFLYHAPYKINLRDSNVRVTASQVTVVRAKDPSCGHAPAVVDALQLADVYVGALSLVLDASGNQRGCCEVADAVVPRVRKMSESPFNISSRAWKRVAMRFFPKESARAQIKTYEQAWGEIYPSRSLRYVSRGQGRLFE